MRRMYHKCVTCSFSVYLIVAVYCFSIGMLFTLLDSSEWLHRSFSPVAPFLFDHPWYFPIGMFLRYSSLFFLFISLILLTFTNQIE